jgi:hypothetical protein
MPIRVQHIEKGIYSAHWGGIVTLQEVVNARNAILDQVIQAEERHYIVIIINDHVLSLPVEVNNLRVLLTPNRLATLLVDAPPLGVIIARMLARMARHHVEFFDTFDPALERARQLHSLQALQG